MTIESGWENATGEQDQDAFQWGAKFPVKVPVEFEQTQPVAPEAVALFSISVPLAVNVGGTGAIQPAQLCPHAYHRHKAKTLWTIPANTTVYLARSRDALMSGALGAAYQIIVGATPVTNSAQIFPDYDGQPALYAVASNAGVQVSVLDQTYKQVQ